MNLLTSYNWIKEYLKTDLSVEEFARLTTDAGNGVEHMDDLAKRFDKMVVGVVKELVTHPDADKLRIAKTDIGSQVVDIVCGGVNLEEGMKVVVAEPGAKVYWHGEGDLMELKKTKIRGIESHGMICAASELGFAKLPQGEKDIWDIGPLTDAAAGSAIAEALGLNDVIMDIEVTTNRPDCMSIIGQAREGSAATKAAFEWNIPGLQEGEGENLEVTIEDKDLCLKYEAIMLDNVQVGPSPWWLQAKLLLAGHKPINNIVDITNYILHEYGQPMHAFDANTLEGSHIHVRRAKEGEKMEALDGNEYELKNDHLVIADAQKPIAVAGVMGGEQTGTKEGTTKIILESATFDPVSVRKTARSLNLYSDSQLLFEKGLSPKATSNALARAVELIVQIAGAKVVSKKVSEEASAYVAPVFTFDPQKTKALIGAEISEEEMVGILERLGFQLEKEGEVYKTTIPYWRDHDIEHDIDFSEEIARIFGYENVPAHLPETGLVESTIDPLIFWEEKTKRFLSGIGLSEMYGFSFTNEKEMQQFDLNPDHAVRILNPLASDQSHMRNSLVPTMLSSIEGNQRKEEELSLFEIAPIYKPVEGDIPNQSLRLCLGFMRADGAQAFSEAKGVLEQFAHFIGVKKMRLERLEQDTRYHAGRSASITFDGHAIGIIGEVGMQTANAFGIDHRVVVLDLDFALISTFASEAKSYTPPPKFPEMKRDIAFQIDNAIEYRQISIAVKKITPLLESIELFDVYRGKGVEEGKKSMAIHLVFRDPKATLEAKVVDGHMVSIEEMLKDTFDAIMR